MKLKYYFSVLCIFPLLVYGQSNTFKISPYVDATTNIKDGSIEVGPQFMVDSAHGFVIRPSVRLPLTDKTNNILQIDRFTSTWRGILAMQFTSDNTQSTGPTNRNTIIFQGEYGSSDFKYYLTGDKSVESRQNKSSYAFEIKYINFQTVGKPHAKQYSPQLRLRYSHDWKAQKEVGIVQPANTNGIVTTTNLIISPPTVTPTLSPAFSLQYYPGKNAYSYSPTIYYDLTGNKGSNNPFGNMGRLRVEAWVFYYPLITGSPNFKIGVTPFLSVRTHGSDDFRPIEYGGEITIKIGTSFLQFF